jgi:hypothetical protein
MVPIVSPVLAQQMKKNGKRWSCNMCCNICRNARSDGADVQKKESKESIDEEEVACFLGWGSARAAKLSWETTGRVATGHCRHRERSQPTRPARTWCWRFCAKNPLRGQSKTEIPFS